MSDVLIIIAQKGFQPVEYADTREELEEAGLSIEVGSILKDVAVGSDDSEINVDIAVKDADVDNYKAVVIIGGPGALSLAEHSEVISLIKQAFNQDKIVAAICISPVILAKAEILNGRKATVWNEDGKQAIIIEDADGKFVDQAVVVDENIITGNGPDAAKDFGREIAKQL